MKAWKKIKAAPLPVLCYGVCIICWLMVGFWSLAQDALAMGQGKLYAFTMQASDFTLDGLHQQADSSYLTETADPQMQWVNPDGRAVRSVQVRCSFSRSPREMSLYYLNAPDQAFGRDRMVYPTRNEDGTYTYRLPAEKIYALRLDPCSPQEGLPVEMFFELFHFNVRQPLWVYFAPGWAGLFGMLVGPSLFAACLSLGHEIQLTKKKKKTESA